MEKNCPFCGKHTASIDTLDYTGGKPGRYRVQCQECLSATRWFGTAEEARAAWNARPPAPGPEPGQINFLFNRSAFILGGLMYYRNPETGNCTAQKEFSGRLLRVKEGAFWEAREKCEKTCGGAKP